MLGELSISLPEFSALAQVILVDLVLAGDNAIVIGMVAAGLPAQQRSRMIIAGILAATVMRILLAVLTVQLLKVVGLVLAGGLLLLWVAWKIWREIDDRRSSGHETVGAVATPATKPTKTLGQAAFQIVVADLSMSLDNVLAVAGIARDHTWVLVIGLALSIAFMGLAATFIARVLDRHHWVAYIGLALILYVAVDMIIDGAQALTQTSLSG